MSITSASRSAVVAVLSFLVAATVVLGLQARADASDPVTPIAAAPDLHWGFKATWRNYAQDPEVSGGATIAPPSGGALGYDLEWAFDSGSYDSETRATHLEYTGTVRWKAHKASVDGIPAPPGYGGEPDPYILDVTFSDPRVTISRDESVVTVVVSSRDADTWQTIDYGRVPIVNLDVLGVIPTVAGGTTAWPGLTATVTAPGHEAMAGFYRVGQVVDPVSFSYEGPGGAPDLAEHWDTPGAAILKQVQNELFYDAGEATSFLPLWADRKNLIVHSTRNVVVGGVGRVEARAFSLAQMKAVGTPIVLPTSQVTTGAYDSSSDRLLYRQSGEEGMRRWLRFNQVTGEYETGTLADPQMGENGFFGTGNAPFVTWDQARDRGYRIQRIVPPGVPTNDFDNHEWQLMVFEEGGGGIWVKRVFKLPSFPTGQNREGYAASTPSVPRLVVASDGSLVALASTRLNLAATEKIHGAYRIAFNQADDAIDAQPIPGLDVFNTIGAGGTFAFAQASANGHILLEQFNGQVMVQCKIDSGGAIVCNNPVSVKDNVEAGPYEENRFAIDPADGTVWFGALTSQKIAAFKNGVFRGAQFFKARHPKGGPVLVGDAHFVYAQTNDGSPGESGGSKTWGFGKFERLGFVPAVTAQPTDDAVALGVGETSEDATFSSTASGDPAPQRQWQVKTPGAFKFTDLAGETGATLTVAGTRSDDGAEYRAVYSNAAGKVATDPAALAVTYAPAVLQDPINVTAIEGTDAEFALLSDGDPAPAVTWQRRVGGFWQSIDPGDENFELEGNRLVVPEANVEQSGAMFRAKLTNALGSVTSKAGKLTVNPKTSIPPGGIDLDRVSLDWLGSAEVQKAPPFGGSNYLSAGASDGDEASYRSVAGNAAIYQLSSAGTESLAIWATRADHTGKGGSQLARLYGGEGRIEPDGSTSVSWEGAFSVNFYGGLAPFTLSDPELEIDEDGDGTLTAELSGYATSQANPNQRTPLTPVPDVTVATFSGVDLDPGGEIEIDPDYAGVQVTVPTPFAPQDRVTAGWGAWPQPFVDFHAKTGLSSYWYTSGSGFDPDKPPLPLHVDFDGELPPAEPPSGGGGGGSSSKPGAGSSPSSATPAQLALSPTSRATLGRGGVAVVAWAICPGPGFCALSAPKKAKVRIGGDVYWVKVIAPEVVPAGGSVKVKVKLPKAVLRSLGRHAVKVRLRVTVRSQEGAVSRVFKAKLRRGKGKKEGTGEPVNGIESAPISGEPPTLPRPATAVDVSAVRVTWHPRDSWVRYASSGVGAGDGILTSGGATGTTSTASACPDRPSTSDAQLPYAIEFAPKASWFDPASGTAGIYGQGSVAFKWASHGIDLSVTDPEIEIAGASSRAIFRFSGSGGTAYPNQRASLVGLDLSGQPVISDGGKTYAYAPMRGTLTADGVNVFAGFYTPPDNDEFGCVSISFTAP